MTARTMITTPIYYVNGSPHIGHAYTSIAADVLARFERARGREVFFLTGTDEHGQKVEKAAMEAGVSPRAFTDRVSAEFRALAERYDISFDDFIRTTEPRHVAATQAFWRRLADAGAIYSGQYEGWYSVRDEAYYGQDELVAGPDGARFAPTGATVELVREDSYFFRLSEYGDRLLDLYERHPDFIAPAARRNEIVNFVRGGLADLSISRTSFAWGIPVPDDDRHVMYVWVDALINYLTALGWPEADGRMAFWPPRTHLVGKEIARFHAVYWPAMLMAAGVELPHQVFSHGWWTIEGEKMSKSVGNVVDPFALADRFGVDAIRFFLLREVPFGRDGDFSESALIRRLNSELANDLGNLAQRTLSLVGRHLAGRRPSPVEAPGEADLALVASSGGLPEALAGLLDRLAFGEALEEAWRVVRAANGYIDREKPWALAKSDPARMADVLRVLLEALRDLATVLRCFMPRTMDRLLDQLGVPLDARDFAALSVPLAGGVALPAPVGLFPRHVVEAAGAAGSAGATA